MNDYSSSCARDTFNSVDGQKTDAVLRV